MKQLHISPSQIAQTLEKVGESIKREIFYRKGKGSSGHAYVVIDQEEMSDYLKRPDQAATFKEMNRLVQHALSSNEISRETKVKMLKGYKAITDRYENKKRGFFTKLLVFLFGQQKQVAEANRLIEKGLMKNQIPEGPFLKSTIYIKLLLNGNLYEGIAKDGALTKGSITENDGTIHQGEFQHDKLNGQGKIKKPDGTLFEGTFKDGQLDGMGSISYPSGIIDQGMFKEGILDGKGTITSNGFKVYEGEFRQGEIMGQGQFFFPDGRTIKSDFFYKGMNGQATIIDGQKETKGEIKNGILEGNVTITENGKIYQGKLENGYLEGSGSITEADGKISQGKFVHGRLNGPGIMMKPGESPFSFDYMYTGEFKDDLPHGHGTFYLNGGLEYTGGVKNGLFHGQGKIVAKTGDWIEGEFNEGLNGKGHRFHKESGQQVEVIFVNGQMIEIEKQKEMPTAPPPPIPSN
ncbi:MAG: hypothetical protein ACH350_08080 [Parachlamydiaceae bacterium]